MALKKSQKTAVAVGAGLAGLAATAAGVYFMTGKNAKNRKKLANWAGKMQKEVLTELHKMEKATKSNYNKVIDTAAKNYKTLKSVSPVELAALANEMKGHWDSIQQEMQMAASKVRKVVPRSAKRPKAKVAVKKAPARKPAAKKPAAKKATRRK
jgi:hypothetical protein